MINFFKMLFGLGGDTKVVFNESKRKARISLLQADIDAVTTKTESAKTEAMDRIDAITEQIEDLQNLRMEIRGDVKQLQAMLDKLA